MVNSNNENFPGKVSEPETFEIVESGNVAYESEAAVISQLGSLSVGSESNLREHQRKAFEKIVNFYGAGGHEGYVLHPTGTGKTVLFVELSQQLIETSKASGEPSRVIILVPKVDLVTQTVGSVDPATGKRRGFAGFAPQIDARSVHGNMTDNARAININDSDVIVSTYDSFRSLIKRFIRAESKESVDWNLEKQEFEKLAVEAETQYDSLMSQRRAFIEKFFVTDETKKAARFLDNYNPLLDEVKPDWLTLTDIEQAKAIMAADLSDADKLKHLKRWLKRIVPRDLWSKPIKKRARSKFTIESLNSNQVIDSSDELEDTSEDQVEDTDEITLLPKRYVSDFEWFATRFIRRHDKPIPRSADVLNNYDTKNWNIWNSLTDSISYQRSQMNFYKGRARAAEAYSKIQTSIGEFDLIIADEAHRSIGTQTWDAIREYAKHKDIAILGLTATDSYLNRSLLDYYEEKIDEITLTEAIESGLNNPMAIFVHDTGLKFSDIELDSYGDYDPATFKELRYHEERNMVGVQYAKILAEAGYGGVISTIPGEEGAHAKLIADLLNNQTIIDPKTGEERHMRAAYVVGKGMSAEDRQYIYKDFEDGYLDWIVYVDILREGWDSDRAKALINLRPTRSPLLARQRQGRVGRLSEDGQVSIIIDLYDGYNAGIEGVDMPPVTAADVFELSTVEQGHVIGKVGPQSETVLQELKRHMKSPIKAHFMEFVDRLESAEKLTGFGIVSEISWQKSAEWKPLRALQETYKDHITTEFIALMTEKDQPAIRTTYGRRSNDTLSKLYNVHDINSLIADMPEVNPIKLYVDNNQDRWITIEGCKVLLSKLAPQLGLEDIIKAIHDSEVSGEAQFSRSFGKVRLSFANSSGDSTFGMTNLYKLSEIQQLLVPKLIHKSS